MSEQLSTTVHHDVAGPADAPVIVLANSLGTTYAMWDAQLPALAERFRVVRYDHRGHGGSPVPAGPYQIAELAADVLALLDRLGVRRVGFCGLSLGGMVGMWLAAHAPERIDRLALLCTSARLGPAEMWLERARAAREHGTASIADVVVARWFTPTYRTAHPEVVAEYVKMISAISDEGYAECCGAIKRMDLVADLAAVTAPTLIIAGADDPATPPAHAEVIAAHIAGARLEVLPGTAHLAAVESPGPVNRLLTEHFA